MQKKFILENDEIFSNFKKYYGALYFKVLDSTDRGVINLSQGVDAKVCKYCGKGRGETTFRNESHAIPLALGNHTLVDSLECDKCNKHFSDYLEDSFLKFTLPHRIINTIRGRKNPKYKDEFFEITFSSRGNIEVNILKEGVGQIDLEEVETGHILKYTFTRQAYRPVAVYKMFVKIALALMPDTDRSRLELLKNWILAKDYTRMFSGVPVLKYEFQGAFNPERLKCGLFKVKDEFEGVYFKYILVLVFGNLQYSVVIPDPISEENVSKTLLAFPALLDRATIEECGEPSYEHLHFESEEVVKGEKVDICMLFEKRETMDPVQ
ncbi:HNH endonuclease [Pseudomonas grimontii]|uniref:HNH endonuclease n=1 Tax=Pseudomonas grimontii TaxID=129847 RepID=UPI00387B154F